MPQTKILFLDKVLNKPLKEDRLRGVEIFNLFFVRELLRLGHHVSVVIHPDWQSVIDREIPPSENLRSLQSARIGGRHLGSLAALWKIRKEKFDSLFLANVGDGVLIPYSFILKHRMVARSTLLAHKVPGAYFLKHLRKETAVVCVNQTIAKPFRESGFGPCDVYYGILNTDQLYPAPAPRGDGKIRFGMLGDLDSEWKGSDQAIEAFLKLPADLADRAELHLAAFSRTPPAVDDPRIIVHEWIDRDKIGDYLRSLDVMLNLSRDLGRMMETFCQTMIQGMLCELPQITTSLDILVEKMDTGAGIVCRDTQEITDAMVELATSEEKRREMGKIAARTARERYVFDSEYFADTYLAQEI